MPPHPETIERFILHVPVTAEQLGPAVVALSRIGLDNLRHEPVTDVVTLALPAPKPHAKHAKTKLDRREVSHSSFILRQASRNHGRFNTAWMKKQFEKDGRKWGAVSPTIAPLLKQKLLKRVGEGEYVLMVMKDKGDGAGYVFEEATHGKTRKAKR